MALLDFLKRKDEVQKAKPKKTSPAKKAENASVKKESKKTEEKTSQAPIKTVGNKKNNFSYSVVKEPHISEKATDLTQDNKYTFKVYSNSNKPEIKKSVEGIYGVNVTSVNVITVPHKKRRLGKTQGFKKGFSKAIVTIKAGQKIEII